MPNSLSVRDQNSFISAYKNLLNDNDKRIHKSDINTLQKILKKCDKIEVSQLLMEKMKSYPKDPVALENTFSKLFDKLKSQNSGMYEEKENKLKIIQQKLSPAVQDIYNTKINHQLRVLSDDVNFSSFHISEEENNIAKLQKTITETDEQIKKLQSEVKTLTDALNNTSQEEFAAKDAQRLKETEAEISKLEAKQNAKISTLKNKIADHENSREKLLDFARKHGVNGAEQDLKKAESGAIYDKRDMGFGTTSWHKHLGSDKYAINNFGFSLEEGRRQYSDLTKVPNRQGKQWQKLMKDFDNAPGNIKALRKEISQLKNKHIADVTRLKAKNELSEKQDIEQRINVKQEAIRSLEKSKEVALENIERSNQWISSQEAEKNSAIEKMEGLKSQLK